MFNVVNPDMIVEKYGADTLRLYEMFLGPLEQSKPWDTNGIDGCHRFLKKMWNLYFDNRTSDALWSDEEPTKEQLKSINKLIKKITSDIENFSFNTAVSAFMICVNELSQLKTRNIGILKQLIITLSPFTPHIAEELWHAIGEQTSICDASWQKCKEEYLVEDEIQMTVSFNGKARFQMMFPADADNPTIEKGVLADERTSKYIDEGKQIAKIIIVPKKIINIVIK